VLFLEEGCVSWPFWLVAIPVLAVLMLIHEVGHFLAARWMKVRVEEFGIGFPPRMLTLAERNGVKYTLNWLLVGGFVRMAGEEDPWVEGSLAGKKPWQRFIVLSAGAAMNLALAFLLFTGLAIYGRDEIASRTVGIYWVEPGSPAERAGVRPGDLVRAVNDRQITSYEGIRLETTFHRGYTVTLTLERDGQPVVVRALARKDPPPGEGPLGVRIAYYEAPVVVQYVLPQSPAAQAGLRPGDVVISIDGQPVRNSLDFLALLEGRMGLFVRLQARREGRPLLPMTIYNDPAYEGLPLGLDYLRLVRQRHGPLEGLRKTVGAALLVPETLAALFRGSVQVSELSGPVGILYVTGRATQEAGLYGLFHLAALISVNLGLVNLFPLPALDGGRLAFVFLEWIRGGKRIPPEKEGLVHMIGFFLLLGLILVVTYFDIARIVNGGVP
jgi:regulator of sigma E protease